MNEPKKSTGRPRQLIIKVNYHFNTAGRRPGIRKDIVERAVNALLRRLERHGVIVDSVETVENNEVSLGA